MLHENIFDEKVLASLISYAVSTLRLSNRQIRKKFTGYPLYTIDYCDEKGKGKGINIRFDDLRATLSCLFDMNKKCDYVGIIPDDLYPLAGYVNYLNSLYEYNYIGCSWILPNGHLSLRRMSDVVSFSVHCLG